MAAVIVGSVLFMTPIPTQLELPDGHMIAYHALPGNMPGVIFLGGFKSDMTGTKALALEAHCRTRGQAFVRFDYLGHGASSGKFIDGTIGRWRDDVLAILDRVAVGPQILVGSSMGGWLALLAALARPDRVIGLVGIAAAADFTRDLLWNTLSDADKHTIETEGCLSQPSDYSDDGYVITKRLIEDGDAHLLLGGPIKVEGPVRLLHGLDDRDVPALHSLRIIERLTSDDVTVTFVKNGDHRLSSPADLDRLTAAVDELTALAEQRR